MSGAQSWSVKGIDPKVREAVREAAARQGLSLGEYLSQALQGQPTPRTPVAPAPAKPRVPRLTIPLHDENDEDWRVSSPAAMPRASDAQGMAQRIDIIERRTQLAVTGLDRAVSTIDRSVLGLAARLEDAEAVSRESADRISEALDHFRVAGDTLGGRLAQAENEVAESRRALAGAHSEVSGAKSELADAKERLEHQVVTAEEVARRAEAAANFLATELESRDAAIEHKLGAFEDQARQTLTEARAAAEEAARQASLASSDAVTELRRLQEALADRLNETERSTRSAVETAIEQTRQEHLQVRETLADVSARIAAADQIKTEQTQLITRIERAEAGAREATAGLRQAAGAAIADLRNAQLSLAARLKQVEETGGRGGGGVDLQSVRQQQSDIAERLASLEQKTRDNPVTDALAAFERRLDEVSKRANSGANEKLEEVDGAVKTLDDALQRLADRIAETESTANTAIRTLEETVSSLGARFETAQASQETEAVRAMLEQRLDQMAQNVTQMVGEARDELAGQVHAALEGAQGDGLEDALADVNRRLAAAERRQAQTIEAISIEIKRMSETVDRRLRAVEARNDDAAASAVREELSRMATTLEGRFDDIERREAAAFDRMGLEVGRLSERLEERVGAVEGRSAQAIEQVGEQVARMGERFNHRQEQLARDLGERMIDSEERSGARVSEAISSIMHRLSEVEQHSADAIAPVQKAVSSVATRLEQFQSGHGESDVVANPTRRFSDFDAFGDEPVGDDEPYLAPHSAAQPTRAAPIAPPPPANADIYFAEDIDIIAEDVDDHFLDEIDGPRAAAETDDDVFETALETAAEEDHFIDEPFTPPPPTDDDPFWTPNAPAPTAPNFRASELDSDIEEAIDLEADADEYSLETPLEPAIGEPMADFGERDPELAEEAPAPPGKNDYLAAARKAALAQTTPKGKTHAEMGATPTYSLRGSSRIVLWGAASAIALLLAGGAWYFNNRDGGAGADAGQPEPPPIPPSHAQSGTQEFDPNQPFGAPVEDPFATAPAEGGAEASESPDVATATETPANVVAGPLAPRSVSLEQAAQSGDLVAQYELALQRISGGRTNDGVTMLRRAADRGLAMAQYRLGKLYERGEGVQADLTIARQWTERAAAAGNRRAMHDLGVYFARGEGAPLDEAAAFRWFRQAAELGVADSQYNLGVLYQQGRGVGASASEAMFWFLVAARQGDQDAAARATALEPQLQPIQVEQARARATSFRPRASSAIANGEFGPRTWNTRSGA